MKKTVLFERRGVIFIIIDEFLVRRCLCLQLESPSPLSPSHVRLIFIFCLHASVSFCVVIFIALKVSVFCDVFVF